MEYLTDRKITHGDLATRNVLLKRKDHVEVADFGLAVYKNEDKDGSEDLKTKKKHINFASKWGAIELLEKRSGFNEETDVWAFGVTCWEIFNFGAEPYDEIKYNEETIRRLLARLKIGAFLRQPTNIHISVYNTMFRCKKLHTFHLEN